MYWFRLLEVQHILGNLGQGFVSFEVCREWSPQTQRDTESGGDTRSAKERVSGLWWEAGRGRRRTSCLPRLTSLSWCEILRGIIWGLFLGTLSNIMREFCGSQELCSPGGRGCLGRRRHVQVSALGKDET